jgi:SAM-dependent methyltransferase
MSKVNYEYRDLLANTWDLFRGDTSGWEDRFFYQEFITEFGEPVLDIGCGTGRLLLDYMQENVDIDGVDNSPEMLALCRRKSSELGLKPDLYQQSMEDLDLPHKYKVILVPSSSFQLLTEVKTARRAMSRFCQHLESGGILIMPFTLIWQEGTPLQTDWEQDGEKVRPEDGALIRRWSRARYDLDNQLEHTESRYEVSLDRELISSEYHSRSPATRWYSQSQAVDLYHQAGFSNLMMFSGFSRKPAKEDDSLFSVIGVRSSAN